MSNAAAIILRVQAGFARIVDQLGRPALLRAPEGVGAVYDPETGGTTGAAPAAPATPLRVVLTERQLQDEAGVWGATRVALVPAGDCRSILVGSILDVEPIDGGAVERFRAGTPRIREVAGVAIMARVPLTSLGFVQ